MSVKACDIYIATAVIYKVKLSRKCINAAATILMRSQDLVIVLVIMQKGKSFLFLQIMQMRKGKHFLLFIFRLYFTVSVRASGGGGGCRIKINNRVSFSAPFLESVGLFCAFHQLHPHLDEVIPSLDF